MCDAGRKEESARRCQRRAFPETRQWRQTGKSRLPADAAAALAEGDAEWNDEGARAKLYLNFSTKKISNVLASARKTPLVCIRSTSTAGVLSAFAIEFSLHFGNKRAVAGRLKNAIFSCQTLLRTVKITAFAGGWIAQLVEQRTENPCVPGSNPGPATILGPLGRLAKILVTLKRMRRQPRDSKDRPHPQVWEALGLRILKPPPVKLSEKSTTAPRR